MVIAHGSTLIPRRPIARLDRAPVLNKQRLRAACQI
jgi:hypothetical protein